MNTTIDATPQPTTIESTQLAKKQYETPRLILLDVAGGSKGGVVPAPEVGSSSLPGFNS